MLLEFWQRPFYTGSVGATSRVHLDVRMQRDLDKLHNGVLRSRHTNTNQLRSALKRSQWQQNRNSLLHLWYAICLMAFIMTATPFCYELLNFLLGVRCFLPNNRLIWQATRPISECSYCRNVHAPLIFSNLTQAEFAMFAYSSQPILMKNAISHWPAAELLSLVLLKTVYERVPGALDAPCQFKPFSSNFRTLRDFFRYAGKQSEHLMANDATWYVGWSNCHPVVLQELRKLYPRPHFLPADAEMPNADYIYMGYEQGAVMHLDVMSRLMWQAQLQGKTNWLLAPTAECDSECESFMFRAEAGDAVLVDTRIWHHGTSIPKGQFSLTIQSEYG